jgi:hypothetical protein
LSLPASSNGSAPGIMAAGIFMALPLRSGQ